MDNHIYSNIMNQLEHALEFAQRRVDSSDGDKRINLQYERDAILRSINIVCEAYGISRMNPCCTHTVNQEYTCSCPVCYPAEDGVCHVCQESFTCTCSVCGSEL